MTRGQASEWVVGGQTLIQVPEQLRQVVAEIVGGELAAITLEGEHRQLVGARRAAEAQIDSTRVKAAQHAEGLGHRNGL